MLEFESKEVSDEELLLREREAEKQELARLLTTAKDEDRKEIIRNAIDALDASKSGEEPTGTLQTSLSASSLASLVSSRILSAGKVPLDTMSGSGRNRPTSAQRRRPSFTPAFEVVPEVSGISFQYAQLVTPSHSPPPPTPTHTHNPPPRLPSRIECCCIGALTGRERLSCRKLTSSPYTPRATTHNAPRCLSSQAALPKAFRKCRAVGSAPATIHNHSSSSSLGAGSCVVCRFDARESSAPLSPLTTRDATCRRSASEMKLSLSLTSQVSRFGIFMSQVHPTLPLTPHFTQVQTSPVRTPAALSGKLSHSTSFRTKISLSSRNSRFAQSPSQTTQGASSSIPSTQKFSSHDRDNFSLKYRPLMYNNRLEGLLCCRDFAV